MFIDCILNEDLSERASMYLKTMKLSMTMLLYLVSDILDLKAIKDGTFFSTMEIFYPRLVFD